MASEDDPRRLKSSFRRGITGFGNNILLPLIPFDSACRLDKNIRADKDEGGSQRLVLSWGRNVKDLDSHMFTPSGCKVWYTHFKCKDNSLDFDVDLDVDDTDFFGPETTTIRKSTRGRFSYFIHIFTKDKKWSQINANVKVYDKTGLVLSVDNPKCTKKRWWHVVDYDPTQRSFTLVNQLKDKANPDISKHALASATLGKAPTCSCGKTVLLPLIDDGVKAFGAALVRTR